MSVRWERLEGDTASFAIKVAFQPDPDDGEGADESTSASWGSFELWVDGENLCAHRDQGETLEGVHWYLLPFFEWLVENWDPLFHEERLPAPGTATDAAADDLGWIPVALMARGFDQGSFSQVEERWAWDQRHGIRAGRDGGIFPGVYLRRLRDTVEISWRNSVSAGAETVDFISWNGRSYQDPAFVAESLVSVLTDATIWMLRQLPDSSRLLQLRESLSSLRSGNRVEERLSWIAGLRESTSGVSGWEQVVQSLGDWSDTPAFSGTFSAEGESEDRRELVVSGSCQAALLFASVDPTISQEDALALAKLLLEQYRPAAVERRLDDFSYPAAFQRQDTAWEQGYELALEFHEEMDNLNAQNIVDVENAFSRLGIELREIALADTSIRAASFAGTHHLPTTAINVASTHASSLRARRFTLAHELCHLLYDRSQGVKLAIASGPWAPAFIEKRANAFAAMYLMPPDLLDFAIKRTTYPFNSFDGVREVARILDVSPRALSEHARNIGYLMNLPPTHR